MPSTQHDPDTRMMNFSRVLFVVFLGTLMVGSVKTALVVWLLVAASYLLWFASKRPSHFAKAFALALFCSGVSLIPIDVQLHETGTVAVDLVPIVWGLPSASTFRDADEGRVILGGCMVPRNAPRYALVVSY